MTEFDQLIWTKIIESLDSHTAQKKLFCALSATNKKIRNKLLGTFANFKNKWRRWYSQSETTTQGYPGSTPGYLYVFQGISFNYIDGCFFMFENHPESINSPIVVGQYSDNKQCGEWKTYFNSDSRAEQQISEIRHYVKGIRVGEQRVYSVKGDLIMIATFNEHGEAHGKQYRCSDAGELTEYFVNGARHGPREIVRNGIVTCSCNYVAGHLHGVSIERWDDGSLKRRAEYQNGVFHGTYLEYYQNGVAMMKGQYQFGLPVGRHKLWWENGKISSDVVYGNDGQPMGEILEYTVDGKLKKEGGWVSPS